MEAFKSYDVSVILKAGRRYVKTSQYFVEIYLVVLCEHDVCKAAILRSSRLYATSTRHRFWKDRYTLFPYNINSVLLPTV